jgi:WD40 repeat protein
LLGAASENGSVYVWDTNARSIVSQFPTLHSSPVTGLAFSPVNEALLCSTGLDQRIHFFDIRKNKLVQTLEADAPITSLAFCGDGHTIAIGSLYGTIQAMDLRNDKQGRMALRGHEGNSVNWMEFVKQSQRESKHIPSRNLTPTAQKVNPPDIKDDTLITKPEFRSIEEIRMFARNRVEEKKKLSSARTVEQPVSTPVSPAQPVVSTPFTPTPSNAIPPSPPPQLSTGKPPTLDTSQRFSNISNLSSSSGINGVPNQVSQSEDFKAVNRSIGEGSPIKDIVANTISNSISEFRIEMQTYQEAILESVHDLHIELIRQFTIQQV